MEERLVFPITIPITDIRDNSVDGIMVFVEVQIEMARESLRDAVEKWKEKNAHIKEV